MTMQIDRGVKLTGERRVAARRDFAARYQAGESIRSLAAGSGRSYGFVHRILTEAGVPLRTRGGPRLGPRKKKTKDQ